MGHKMARIDDLKTELTEVRAQIKTAYEASAVSVEGRGMTRQNLVVLQDREAKLELAIKNLLRGSAFGKVEIDV